MVPKKWGTFSRNSEGGLPDGKHLAKWHQEVVVAKRRAEELWKTEALEKERAKLDWKKERPGEANTKELDNGETAERNGVMGEDFDFADPLNYSHDPCAYYKAEAPRIRKNSLGHAAIAGNEPAYANFYAGMQRVIQADSEWQRCCKKHLNTPPSCALFTPGTVEYAAAAKVTKARAAIRAKTNSLMNAVQVTVAAGEKNRLAHYMYDIAK